MNEIFEVAVERIVPDGAGIGFAANLTFFVPLAAPGDRVKVRVTRRKGKIAFAEIVEILEFSPARVAPPCPVFGRCGGCDFQHLNYAAQLAAKVGIIKDCLRRIAKIDFAGEIEIVGSPAEWNYRTRAQWKREKNKLGYFERNSHRVVDVAECPILAAPLADELAARRADLKKTDFAEVQAVSGGEDVSRLIGGAKNLEANFDENFYAANKQLSEQNRAAAPADLDADKICVQVGEFSYEFSAAVFFQVNHQILPAAVEYATSESSGKFVLDLYCGVGLFSLPLARKFERLVGVEGNQKSINFARRSAAGANLENTSFETAYVGEWLVRNAADLASVDFVLLDPPRTGAERETIESLLAIKPARIVYVSCNPATLARDLRLLAAEYKIERIKAFDFFPQTHHVETIVHLKIPAGESESG